MNLLPPAKRKDKHNMKKRKVPKQSTQPPATPPEPPAAPSQPPTQILKPPLVIDNESAPPTQILKPPLVVDLDTPATPDTPAKQKLTPGTKPFSYEALEEILKANLKLLNYKPLSGNDPKSLTLY
jgi:hypothetical protein